MSNETNKATEVAVSKDVNLAVNVAPLDISANEDLNGMPIGLMKYGMPTGGATSFRLNVGDENDQEVKEIVGVLVYHHPAYSYYKEQYDGTNRLPDCYSNDGIIGCGNPGGDCKACPFNKFQTGKNGVSKACKNKRNIYILTEDSPFPKTLLLPTGSLQNFTKYVQTQVFSKRKLAGIVTKITLKKATNKTGIAFSQAVFSYVRDLTEKELESVKTVQLFAKTYAASHIPDMQDDPLPFTEVTEAPKQ